MKLTKPFLFLIFFSLLSTVYSILNRPVKGNYRGYITLRGEVAYTSFGRAYVVDENHRFWRVYTYKQKLKVYVGDFLTVRGYAKGFKVYPKRVEIERNFLQRFRVKLHTFLKRKFLKVAKSKANKKLGSALLFGENWFSKKERKKLGYLGVYHLVVISGMHYALFLTFFYIFPLRFNIRYIFASGFFSFFTFLVLFPKAPAYRAFTSVALFLLAKLLERPYSSIKALLIAYFLSLLFYPYWITNIGFWLSYLASLALILYYGNRQPAENEFLRNFFGKFLGLEATLVVTVTITPLLVYSFHYCTLGGFLYTLPLTFLVQIYILVATLNLFTLFSFEPTLYIQERIAQLFMDLFYKFPEQVYFKVSKVPLEFTLIFILLSLVILTLPIKKKGLFLLVLLMIEIFLFKTFFGSHSGTNL